VFWSDLTAAPEPAPRLATDIEADLAVVGAGFSGLWTALQAVEADPGRQVVVVEAETTGFGASSRNGGFCEASLTHGTENGRAHWPDEADRLEVLGHENLAGIYDTLERHQIDAAVERTGVTSVATAPWQVGELETSAAEHGGRWFDRDEIRARIHSPTYLAGLFHDHGAMIDPARLAWGLRAAGESLGVQFFDRSPVRAVTDAGNRLRVETAAGSVSADRVVIATNAFGRPERRVRRYVVPVYDHVLMTEPLSSAQMESIGWREREGLADTGNQFHYYRLTEDDRILWGGYDALYHFNNGVAQRHDQNDRTHLMLADHFFETFPQLEDIDFTHRWGGPIATTTRFTATWGTRYEGRLAWVAGYTGLGVGASRFGARVALDLVDGQETERTRLAMVRKKPFPFPPEPFRWAGVQITRRAIQRTDARGGRRGPWLRLLDRFGIGFDS